MSLNKEARFMAYSWTKEAGLTNLCRSRVGREQSLGSNYEEGEVVDIFHAHYQHLYMTRGRLYSLSLTLKRRLCHFPVGLSLYGALHGCAHASSRHQIRNPLTQGFLHFSPSALLMAITTEGHCPRFYTTTLYPHLPPAHTHINVISKAEG